MYQIRTNKTRLILVVALILSVLTSCFLFPQTLYAIGPPDDIDIPDVYVFRNLLTNDVVNFDQLYIVHYNLEYSPYPTDYIVRDSFIFKLIDTDGTTLLGTQLAYSYANRGYGHGIVAFYFTAATAPTWGIGLTVRIAGNPVAFVTPPSFDKGLSSTNYITTADHATNQYQLKMKILDLAEYFESAWMVALTSSQDDIMTLSSNGEKYFRTSIAGIQNMAPGLFFLQSQTINTTGRTWGSYLSDFYVQRLAGPDTIQNTGDENWMVLAIQRPFNEFNIPYTLGIGFIVVLIAAVLIWQSKKHFDNATPGYVGSLLVVMCAGILTLGFTLIAVIALGLALIGGWILFMRKA